MSNTTVLNCLWDAVNFRGVCDTTSNTVAYINDIPSIDNLLLTRLINDENIDASKVWDKVRRRGILTFYNRILSGLSKKFIPKTLVKNIVNAEWRQPFTDLSTQNKLVGVRVDLRGSENMELNLRTANIYVPAAASSTLYIYDLETGVLLDSVAFSFVSAGFQVININKSFSGNRLFVCYDASVIASRAVSAKGQAYIDNIFCGCGCDSTADCREITKGTTVIDYNLTGASNCGMILTYNIGCSLASWVCSMREQLCGMLMYHLANELFIEAVGSLNINPATLTNSEDFDALVRYVNTEFDNLFKPFLEGVKINDPFCVECNAPTQKVWFRP